MITDSVHLFFGSAGLYGGYMMLYGGSMGFKFKCKHKDLHLIMGQKHLIWDRVWDVKSRKSNLYNIYIYMMHLWFYFFMRTH